MAMLGDISEFSVPDILQMFDKSAKTGQLSVWSPTGIYRIHFQKGRIITAVAPEPKYGLKRMLLAAGCINSEGLAYLKTASEIQEPLGNILRKKKFIEAPILVSAFRKQVQVGVHRLFQLQTGQFRFASHAPCPYEEMTGLSKGSMHIAIGGLRALNTTDVLDKKLPKLDSIFVRTSQELPLIKLSNLEWKILEKASSEYKVNVLSNVIKTDLLEVRRACQRLEQVGLLEEITAMSSTPSNLTPAPSISPQGVPPKPVQLAQTVPEESSVAPVNLSLLNRLATMLRSVK